MDQQQHAGNLYSTRWNSWRVILLIVLLISLALNLIVALGNWQLYSRVEKLEAIHESQGTPQFPQIPSR